MAFVAGPIEYRIVLKDERVIESKGTVTFVSVGEDFAKEVTDASDLTLYEGLPFPPEYSGPHGALYMRPQFNCPVVQNLNGEQVETDFIAGAGSVSGRGRDWVK